MTYSLRWVNALVNKRPQLENYDELYAQRLEIMDGIMYMERIILISVIVCSVLMVALFGYVIIKTYTEVYCKNKLIENKNN